ncbi:MAG TPA: GAF domain-containing protein [Anaerolineales bacterium]|nr:GAF domain-containing protein [Anaerolineales bacterium]
MTTPTKDSYSSLKLLFDISRELVSALDLRTVLQRVLSRSLEIVKASSASIIVLNRQGAPIDAAIIVDGEIHEGSVERLKTTLESGLAGWVVRNREIALVTNTDEDERWESRSYPGEIDIGPKSSLCVPLLVRESLVGVMTLTHHTPNYYDESYLALVQAVADQAAIATQNARLFEASQRRADVMSVLAESAVEITSSLELTEVLNRILEQTLRSLKVESVALGLVEAKSQEILFQAVTGDILYRQVGQTARLDDGAAGWAALHGEALIVDDAQNDKRFAISKNFPNHDQVRSIAAAPILTEGDVIGVLEAVNPQESFTDDDLLLLKGIGGLAGTAIRHARLFNQVQSAHGQYRQLFEDSINPIFMTNWNGEMLEANRQAIELSGFSKDYLLEMKIYHFHAVNWKMVGLDYTSLKTGDAISYESELQPKLGGAVPVEVHVHAIDIGGEQQLQWIMHDITELKNLDRLREDLTSMIYHDLRSPLANVVSGLDLIRTMIPEGQGIESVIDIAERSINRVQRLVSSLLDTSRLQAGQKITSKTAVLLNSLIKDAVDAVRPAAEASSFNLQLELPDEDVEIMLDADMIRRVIINLLENAMKFSSTGLSVWVGAEKIDTAVQIWVKDEGRGISPEDQSMIFEKFMRAKRTAGKIKGLGLGLAFCKLAVEGHGGKIWVDSKLGEGSKFTFLLPLPEN